MLKKATECTWHLKSGLKSGRGFRYFVTENGRINAAVFFCFDKIQNMMQILATLLPIPASY